MKTVKRVMVLAVALVAMLALGSCNQGGGSDAAGSRFQGFNARSVDELANLADTAMETAAKLDEDKADSQQKAKAESEFHEGNTRYRAKSYAEATDKYQKALEYDAKNHGANVNLTLSLLQEGRDEEAFVQALRCVALFPDDAGCLLNAQAAGTACKFYATDLNNWLNIIVDGRGGASVESVLSPTSKNSKDSKSSKSNTSWNDAYTYNALWNRIETDLYPGEKTWENAPDTSPHDAYLELKESLSQLPADDEDVAYLQAYLEAVASQLGL